jgi:succinate dehydrogenase/fumarate reductase flavoprotein subunit
MSQETFDVVVVGGGGSGLAAAAQAGRSVVVLEKAERLGGTTALSVGSITAAGTSLQRRAGIDDSADAHYRDLDLFARQEGAVDNLALRRLYVDNAGATVEWLTSLGVVFHGPSPEPPHTRARLHLALPHSGAYVHALSRACRNSGVQFRFATTARRLLVEGGRVAGVEADTRSGPVTLRARKGVILASGDYSGGSSLLRELSGERYAKVRAINATNTGDGHTLARALGARVLNGGLAIVEMRFPMPVRAHWARRLSPGRLTGSAIRMAMRGLPRFLLRPVFAMNMTAYLAPSTKLFEAGAVLVNRRGTRFTDECGYPAFDLALQPAGCAWIVFDASIASRFDRWPGFVSTAPGFAYAYLSDYRRYRPDVFHCAASLDALARAIDLPGAALRASAARLRTPPFFALGPLQSWVMTTDGGLAITEKFEVLGADGPIAGLYAVGSVGQGGLLLPGHGQHLGWAFTSGRLCGRGVARSG